MKSYGDLSTGDFERFVLALLGKKHAGDYQFIDSDGMDCMVGKMGYQIYKHCGGQWRAVQDKIRDAVEKARGSSAKPEGLTFVSTFHIRSSKQMKWLEKYRGEQAPFGLCYWSTEQLDALSAEFPQIASMFLNPNAHRLSLVSGPIEARGKASALHYASFSIVLRNTGCGAAEKALVSVRLVRGRGLRSLTANKPSSRVDYICGFDTALKQCRQVWPLGFGQHEGGTVRPGQSIDVVWVNMERCSAEPFGDLQVEYMLTAADMPPRSESFVVSGSEVKRIVDLL